MRRISVTTVSAALAVLAALPGCWRGAPEPLDVSDSSISLQDLSGQARERGDAMSSRAERFAPQMAAAGRALLAEADAASDEAQARTLLAEADAYFRGAEQVADAVAGSRQLVFPSDRSLGQVSVCPWGQLHWRSLGPAQGTIEIEAETMVSLQAAPQFGDADMEWLVGMGPGAVQYLSLGDSSVTAAGLELLPQLAGLRDLSLSGANLVITDAELPLIARCRALRHLNLMNRAITDAGIVMLARLPALEELALEGAGITDRALFTAAALPSLKSLLLRSVAMTDVGVEHLARAASLERLWIGGKAVTDFSVPVLAELKALNELVLLQTSITESGRSELKKALPRCKIDTTS